MISSIWYAIVGENGTIDGQGKMWWEMWWNRTLKHTRGHLLELMNSNNILISNLTFQNSPFWTIHPVYCRFNSSAFSFLCLFLYLLIVTLNFYSVELMIIWVNILANLFLIDLFFWVWNKNWNEFTVYLPLFSCARSRKSENWQDSHALGCLFVLLPSGKGKQKLLAFLTCFYHFRNVVPCRFLWCTRKQEDKTKRPLKSDAF